MNYQKSSDIDDNVALQQFRSAIYDASSPEFDPIELGLSILKNGDFQQRWEVAKLFPKLGNKIIEPLLNILKNETIDFEVRWFVGRILSEFDDPKIVLAFVDLLQTTQEEELPMMATDALSNIGRNSLESLEQLLTDNTHKLLAVKALAKIRHSQSISALLNVVNDSNPEIRSLAIEALGSFHQSELIPIFIKALKDPVVAVRKEAIIALGMQSEFQEEFELINQLIPLLYDINLEVCQQAILALGRMKETEAIEALSQLLQSQLTPIGLKKETVKALNWMGMTQGLEGLEQALWQAKELEIIENIILVLGDQITENFKIQATQILLDFFGSDKAILQDKQIKKAFAVSLGELRQPMAINPLKQLTADSEKMIQLHAIASLKKIELDQ